MALQKAHNTILKADPVLTQFVNKRVFDDIPRGSEFPYIQIGDSQDIDNGNTCDSSPTEVFCRIHIWVRGPQRGIVADQIAHQVRKLLADDSIVLDDYVITVANFVSTDTTMEQNELEIHSVVTLRYLLQGIYVP